MSRWVNASFLLGSFCLLAGLMLIFVWIPADTESGIIEHIRGRDVIGDSMAPSVAATLLCISGLLLAAQSIGKEQCPSMSGRNFMFLFVLVLIVSISFAMMRWTGPAFVEISTLLGFDTLPYRSLRDTVPWKYLGYITGGTFLVFTLISLVEHQFRWRRFALALGVCGIFALIYDLPFDTLLLPPN